MNSRLRARVRVLPFLLAFVAGLSLMVVATSPNPATAVTKTVNISGFSFSPTSITINAGDTVKWVHDSSGTPHSVTADNGSFDSSPSCPSSGCLGANATYSHQFKTAGTFRYYCKIHGGPGGVGMSGTVIVKPGPSITSVSPTTAKHGTSTKLAITGKNFVAGITAKVGGTGVTVNSVTRVDASHLSVKITVASTAAKTKRSITVTNPNGASFTKPGALTIT